MEAYQVNVLASAMLRNFEQIQDPEKSRFTCQLWSDVGKPDHFDRVHLDLTFLHAISAADRYAWAHPDSDSAGDLSVANSLAKAFGKQHVENLLQLASRSILELISNGDHSAEGTVVRDREETCRVQ